MPKKFNQSWNYKSTRNYENLDDLPSLVCPDFSPKSVGDWTGFARRMVPAPWNAFEKLRRWWPGILYPDFLSADVDTSKKLPMLRMYGLLIHLMYGRFTYIYHKNGHM